MLMLYMKAQEQRLTGKALTPKWNTTAAMQMLCIIFQILSLQLMKGSSFEQVFWAGLCFEEEYVFLGIFFIIIILPYFTI